MKERPINLRLHEAAAIVAGRQTQLRRPVKELIFDDPSEGKPYRVRVFDADHRDSRIKDDFDSGRVLCPYGQPGDRLWGRETHSIYSAHGQHRADGKRWGPWGGLPTRLSPDLTKIAYFREGFDRCDPGRWRSPIIMPRWASRIALEITGVRVERVQDISAEDCIAEGLTTVLRGHEAVCDLRDQYRRLFESLHGPGSWDANLFVWVIEFPRFEA